ncbi:MAG: hypothetical protein V4805_12290 [Pseudomonadota bacterium]
MFAVLLMIALLFFAKMLMQEAEGKLNKQLSIAALLGASDSRLDTALANFEAVNKRLPCPANGSIASGALNAGVETLQVGSGLCNPANQSNGVLPWVTLGISENDALDPWNGRITYRVQPALASNLLRLMNMSWCDPAGTPSGASGQALACTAGCAGNTCMNPLNFLYSKGLKVQDGASGWLNQSTPAWPGSSPPPPNSSGAAYVLISHGPTGAGAFNSFGLLQAGTVTVGANESANLNNQALLGTTIFIDMAINNSASTAHFDDYLSHPTLTDVLGRVSLGARTPH